MPGTTPIYALPYPLPTEPVAEGAQAIRNLAEAIGANVKPRYAAKLGDQSGDWSTSSPTLVKVATALDLTIVCRGKPLQLTFQCTQAIGSASGRHDFSFFMDGVQIPGAVFYQFHTTGAYAAATLAPLEFVFIPASGSHLFSVYHRDAYGTGAYVMNNATHRPSFVGVELDV